MKPIRMDDLWQLLPPVEELQPVLDLHLVNSLPDPARAWTGSGELDTAGGRLVDPETLEAHGRELAADVHRHLSEVYATTARALGLLGAGDRNGAASAFLEVAALEEARNRFHRAEAWARAAAEVSQDERDHTVHARSLRRQARACRAQGKLEEALLHYDAAWSLGRSLDDPRGAAEAALGAGNVLEDQGRWPEAEARYREALQILDEAGLDDSPERWHGLLNVHIVLRSQGDLEACRPVLEQAEAAARGDGTSRVFLENARGQLRQAEGDLQGAEAHFRAALAAAGSALARVVVGVNLAEALRAQGRLLDATEAARAAELEAVSGAAVTRLPEVYRVLGRIASQGGNPDAFVLFERALEITRERGLPRVEEARTLLAYAEAEARGGDPGAAQNLYDEAAARFRELGMNQPPVPWSHGAGATTPPASPDPDDSKGGTDE